MRAKRQKDLPLLSSKLLCAQNPTRVVQQAVVHLRKIQTKGEEQLRGWVTTEKTEDRRQTQGVTRRKPQTVLAKTCPLLLARNQTHSRCLRFVLGLEVLYDSGLRGGPRK